ncbi:helix-turn-helix domain-containing protein [Lentibacillus juripiscarius]|uniref:Helix-turn-helix domain-containing protein n=1 Tax=Lentibacillus juripiscarius TaxID=257446 RepID=A0ABW5V6V6_9BACI
MIGEKIKRLRMEQGLSISELANEAGVAKSYLSSIERSIQKNPSIQFIEKISSVLGVSADDLIRETRGSKMDEQLDEEWMMIVQDAIKYGMTKEQFREFVDFHKWRTQQKD